MPATFRELAMVTFDQLNAHDGELLPERTVLSALAVPGTQPGAQPGTPGMTGGSGSPADGTGGASGAASNPLDLVFRLASGLGGI